MLFQTLIIAVVVQKCMQNNDVINLDVGRQFSMIFLMKGGLKYFAVLGLVKA